MQLRFLIIYVFLCLSSLSYSQEYNYQHYDLTNGLSGLTVYSIAQDKNSYLWFATETGVSRFDGSNFKNFTTSDGLPDNEILKIYVDSENRVWMLPFTNSICYYKDGEIHSQKNDSVLAKLKFLAEPHNIFEDKEGNIVIIERSQFHIIRSNGEIYSFNKINNAALSNINVGINEKGNVEIFTSLDMDEDNWGLLEINKKKPWIFSYKMMSDNSKHVSYLTFIKRNQLIAYLKNDSIVIHSGKNEVYKALRAPQNFIGFSYLSDSLFTMNCNNKVLLFNINSNNIIDTFSLGKTVNCSFLDNEGNFWFATAGYGIYRLTSFAFKNYSFFYDKDYLPVYSAIKKDNDLLVGTNHSLLWKIDLKGSNLITSEHINVDYGQGRVSNLLLYDKDIIVGIDGLHYIHPDHTETSTLGGNTIKNVVKFNDTILISTHIGVYQSNINTPDKSDTLWKTRSTCAYKLDTTIFIGTLNGLYGLDTKKRITFLGKEQPVLSSRVSAMDGKGDTLWIATYGNGIVALKDNKILAHITEENGLTSNMCRNLALTKSFLWVGTDRGLNRISLAYPATDISNYTTNNGLSCDIVNCIYTENDTVYIGTPYGLTFLDPAKVDNNSIAVLNIDNIASRKYKWTGNDSSIHLSPDDNRLSVEFSCVSFKSQGNITYYYRLIGADNQWHTTKENKLDFPSLSPGDYKLELYAINAFGKESNKIVIAVTIDKYFYQQLWFILLITAIILAGLWFLISKRIARIHKSENEKLLTQKRLSELEQLAFRAQMNPHFIFNCLNSIQQYIFSKNAIDANKFITEFASLIRQTMELSARKLITLADEIKFLTTYLKLEHTRFEENFDYYIHVDENIDPENIYVPSLLLQPFLENSIRHGIRNLQDRRGKIILKFSLEKNFLLCTIEDNGIGIAAAKALKNSNSEEYESKGIELIKRRIEALNIENQEKINLRIENSFQNESNKGTTVILQIPVNL